jgi:hypothetical protein
MISFDFEHRLMNVIGTLSFGNSITKATVTLSTSNPTILSET